jgi:lysine 2,3-aminomutase
MFAGFDTPAFVVDTPGGGGKRDVHSFEYYDRRTGISVYTAPSVKPGRLLAFFDPLRDLASSVQESWRDPVMREEMITDALARAGRGQKDAI